MGAFNAGCPCVGLLHTISCFVCAFAVLAAFTEHLTVLQSVAVQLWVFKASPRLGHNSWLFMSLLSSSLFRLVIPMVDCAAPGSTRARSLKNYTLSSQPTSGAI